eukprot:gene7913-9291_t
MDDTTTTPAQQLRNKLNSLTSSLSKLHSSRADDDGDDDDDLSDLQSVIDQEPVVALADDTELPNQEEAAKLKEALVSELSKLDLAAPVRPSSLLGYCECSLLYNHLTTANLIVTTDTLAFLPKQQVHRGYYLESYLHLKGDFFWKKYWFVLSNESLSWYRSSELKETYYPNGTIPLKNVTSIQRVEGSDARPFCLQIVTHAQIYLLQADSVVQLDQWVTEISRIQRHLTVVLPLSECVAIEMESEAALFFDSIYITSRRGENYIITPTTGSNRIYHLILTAWHSVRAESTDLNRTQKIEFQNIFKISQRVTIAKDLDSSYEGTIYVAEEGLYFNSEEVDDSVILIIPATDIISVLIDPKSESPEAIKVVSKEYEVYHFDLIEDHVAFFDVVQATLTKSNANIQFSKIGELPLTAEVKKAVKDRWQLPILPISIPRPTSIPIPIFRSKSVGNIQGAQQSQQESTNHDKTIFIQRHSPPNIESELHHMFPSLPLNEAILNHQTCTLYYYTTNTFVEGQVFITKSFLAFTPTNATSHNSTQSLPAKTKHMKALIPFEDVVSIKKDRYSVFFKHCVKVYTHDHKWIFGELSNYNAFARIVTESWGTHSPPPKQGVFTALESVRIRQNLGLPSDEPLITWYNCTNFKGVQLKYGKLFITKHFICFRSKYGFQKRSIVIPFSSVTAIRKHSVLLPNGLKITTNRQDIEFASFLHRGRVYKQMVETWNANKLSETPTLYSQPGGVPRLDLLNISSPIISPAITSPKSVASLRITILTIGSRGDIQPFIALARALRSHGHDVTLASHELYRDLISRDNGLKFAVLGGDPKELMDLCVRNGIFTPKFIREALSKFRTFIDDLLRTCWEAAQGAEALIATPGCFAGPHIAEALQIPFFHSFTMPFTRTRTYPNPFAPFASSQLGGVFNLATHMMMEKILWQPVAGQINTWRVDTLKLPAWNSRIAITETYRLPYLYCFSKFLVPKPSDWGGEIAITGYWNPQETNDLSPPPALVEFLKSCPQPPIFIGFGSIVIEDPNALSAQLVEAIRATGRRAIISQGWGGLKPELDDKIFLLEQPVAHSWLFEQVALVIHHGGAGTTAAGIYAARPSIVVPFFGDQFFWGERLQDQGIGMCIPQKTLSAKSLANAITTLIDDVEVLARVSMISKNLKEEDGLKNALDAFHRYLPYSYVPPYKQAMGPANNCHQCKSSFGLINQLPTLGLLQNKAQCSHCAKVFCNSCTSNKSSIPKFRINQPVRSTIPNNPGKAEIYPSQATIIYDSSPLLYADLSGNATQLLSLIHTDSPPMGFSSEASLVSEYTSNPGRYWGGIIFDTVDLANNFINFTIRMNSTYGDLQNSPYLYYEQSIYNAFTTMKVQQVNNGGLPLTMSMNTTAYPTPTNPRSLTTFNFLFPIYFPLFFAFSLQQLIILLVTEKKDGIKEGLKVMGMKEGAYWLSNVLTQLIMNIILILMMLVMTFPTKIFVYSSALMIFLAFFFFSLTLIGVAFLSSTFLSTPKTASSISTLFILVGVGLSCFLQFYLEEKVPGIKYLFYLLSPCAFGAFLVQLSFSEANKVAVAWNDPAFTQSIGFMCLDFALYSILAWYSIEVYTGDHGSGKPWNFFLNKSYWVQSDIPELSANGKRSVNDYLLKPTGEGIELRNLFKEYNSPTVKDGKVVAVNELSMNIESGTIFALLGHNGAGKSTTMGILTGMVPPTRGSAWINGLSVVSQMDHIRRHIGFCPQNNLLYNQLTCAEHLRLFGRIKGVPSDQIESSLVKSLQEVDLLDKKDVASASLSGGMKRRLSLAMAFIGNPSIVILDECTTGLDPYARHQVWDLLQSKKAGKTLILSTHFMEEAEMLAEKIAIMAAGKLRAMGTAMELKNMFGLGYIVSITFDRDQGQIKRFEDLFYSIFRDAGQGKNNQENRDKSHGDLELTYTLQQQSTESLTKFFETIEPQQKDYGIKRLGISMTTLEEVFLKIQSEGEDDQHQ